MADITIIQSQSWLHKFQINTDELSFLTKNSSPQTNVDSNTRPNPHFEVQMIETWPAPFFRLCSSTRTVTHIFY